VAAAGGADPNARKIHGLKESTMSQTETLNTKQRLDEFAQSVDAPTENLPAPIMVQQMPDIIHGAQKVAERRNLRDVFAEIDALGAAAGEDWYYRYPTNNRDGTKGVVEGLSVKGATAVALIYGNCEVTCAGMDYGTVYLYRARFVDLQSGFSLERPYQMRKSASKMGRDAARNEDAAYQIGASKATRNVITNALRTYCDRAFHAARNSLVDRIGRNLDQWRGRLVERIATMTDLDRVEAVVGRPAKNWLAPDIARIVEMTNAVADGMASVDETFPPLGGVPDEREMVKTSLDKFASRAAPEVVLQTTPAEAVRPSPPEPEAAGEPTTPVAEGARPEALRLAFTLAQQGHRSVQDRCEALDLLEPQLHDLGLPTPFIKQVLATAAKIAKGELKGPKQIADARLWLAQLP
jgi:hypothetical protein